MEQMLDMDFTTRFAFTFVACIALLHMTEAGCKEDLEKDEDFIECQTGYSVYLANIQSEGNSQDGTKMVALLCSEEGQAALSCLKKPLEDCPELKNDEKFQVFAGIDQMGGCKMAPSSEACSAAMQECSSMSSAFGGDQTALVGASTQYNMYQENVKIICGGLKSQFDCLKRYEKTCPNLENQFRQVMEQGRAQAKPGTPFPDFDSQKAFVMNKCEKFPKDFTTSKCVNDTLMTSEFKTCYWDANGMNTTAGDPQTMSCQSYKATFPCVTNALESCGTAYQDAFRTISNFYMAALEEDCQLTSGSVSVRQMAFPAVVILLFLFSKMVYV